MQQHDDDETRDKISNMHNKKILTTKCHI